MSDQAPSEIDLIDAAEIVYATDLRSRDFSNINDAREWIEALVARVLAAERARK